MSRWNIILTRVALLSTILGALGMASISYGNRLSAAELTASYPTPAQANVSRPCPLPSVIADSDRACWPDPTPPCLDDLLNQVNWVMPDGVDDHRRRPALCWPEPLPQPCSTRPPLPDANQVRSPALRWPAAAWQLIDFERAELVSAAGDPHALSLRVSGMKPTRTTVKLVPDTSLMHPEEGRNIGTTPSDYLRITVMGCTTGLSLPSSTQVPYTVTLPLTGSTGRQGVEVIGATQVQRLEVPAVPPVQPVPGACGDWQVAVNHQPLGSAVLHVSGVCEFPTGGYRVALRRHAPQGFNPHILLLNLVVEPPTGVVTQAFTRVPVHYEEETKSGFFEAVTILPDGGTIPVPAAS